MTTFGFIVYILGVLYACFLGWRYISCLKGASSMEITFALMVAFHSWGGVLFLMVLNKLIGYEKN